MSLVPTNANQSIVVKTTGMSDADWAGVASSSKFLPRIQLMGSNSNPCKQGKFSIGNYALITGKDQYTDLGKQFDCLVINVRPKAMDLKSDPILTVFNKESTDFKQIVERSKTPRSGCIWGPEFLLWLPEQQLFACLFFSNPTMRRESVNMRDLLGKAATCKVQYIDTGEFSWHGPVITQCSTPFEFPSMESIETEVEKFLSSPETEEVEDEVPAVPDRPR